MAQREATPSSVDEEIRKLASPFRPVASLVAMSFYSLACVEFFSTAIGASTWAATLVSLARGAGGGTMPAEYAFVGLGVVFLLVAYFANRFARSAHTLKADLRAAVPIGQWIDLRRHARPIGAWIVALPLMTMVAFKLASATDAYAAFGVFATFLGVATLTLTSSWIVAAMLIGASKDRDAIKGLSLTLLSYLFFVIPFGKSLFQIAPHLDAPGVYSPLAPNVQWVYAVLFYVVIVSRTLLIFENEGDYDQIRLVVDASPKNATFEIYPPPDLVFEKAIYLSIVPKETQLMTFVRDSAGDEFRYVPLAKILDTQLRVDRECIRIFNLTSMSAQLAGDITPIKGVLEITGRITCSVRESEFSHNFGRKFNLQQIQAFREIFSAENIIRIVRICLIDVVQQISEELVKPMTEIEGKLTVIKTRIDSATIKSESQARLGAALLRANSAAAIAAGDAASKAFDQVAIDVLEHFEKLKDAESLIITLPIEIIKQWNARVSEEIDRLDGRSDREVSVEIGEFRRVLGVGIEIDPVPVPEKLVSLRTKLENATGFSSDTIREIQTRSDEAAEKERETIVVIATDPNLRDAAKAAAINTLNATRGPAVEYSPRNEGEFDEPGQV